MMVRLASVLSITPLAALLASCGSVADPYAPSGGGYMANVGVQPNTPQSSGTLPDNISYWEGDGVQGAPSIVVDLRNQRAEFYKGQQLVGVSAISSGKDGHLTPAGNYTILEKVVDKYSTSYGSIVDNVTGATVNPDATPSTPCPPGTHYQAAPMPYWMRLTNTGVGMHAGFLPGYAASHGCIRMPRHMAETFHHNVSVGTPVRVTY